MLAPKPQSYSLKYGFKEAQGRRPTMEDESYINLNCKDSKNQYESCAIFAVYDGHGGVGEKISHLNDTIDLGVGFFEKRITRQVA